MAASIRGKSVFNAWHLRPHLAGFLLLADSAADRCYDQVVASLTPMSEGSLRAFIAQLKDDKILQEKLRSAQTAEHVVEIAKQHGHRFSVDNVKNTLLDDDELEVVNGGTANMCNTGNGALTTAAIAASVAWCGVPPGSVGM